jgi:hypothetical protein
MRQDFQEIFNFTISIREVIANILMATFCGVIISFIYTLSQRSVSYSVTLVKSIIMLSMITAFVMMVVGDNLARAFGIVGIISIIRFRTPMQRAQDFMFIYFALAMGLSSGVGLYSVALVGTLLMGLIILVLSKINIGASLKRKFTLSISSVTYLDGEKQYTDILSRFCKKHKLMATNAVMKENASLIRFSYFVSLKKGIRSDEFMQAIQAIEGVKEIKLQFEEE